MSTVTGSVTRKKGDTVTTLKIAHKTTKKIPPADSAEFLEKLKSLVKQYNMKIIRKK